MTSPSFSICIPYYQNEAYLIEAVESVARQTIQFHELVVSLDNNITDRTRERIREVVPDSQILRNPKPGIAGNWNHCIDWSTGSHTVLLHGDDQIAPDYLETIRRLINDIPAAAWFCSVTLIDDAGKATHSLADSVKPWLLPKGDPFIVAGDKGMAGLLRGCYIYCPSVCYRSDIIKAYRFSGDWKMALDLELYWRLLRDGLQLAGTTKACYQYRRHNQNQTFYLTERTERFAEEWGLYNDILKQIDPATWPETTQQAQRKLMLRLHLLYDTAKRILKGNFAGLKERAQLLKSS